MNKRKKNEKTRTFNWRSLPKCAHQKLVKMPNGVPIYVCLSHKGTGRNGFYCSYVGIEPQCKFYKAKNKWGRNLTEMVGDLL